MNFILIGIAAGIFISAILNAWYGSGPKWIKTGTLVWAGAITLAIGVAWGYLAELF